MRYSGIGFIVLLVCFFCMNATAELWIADDFEGGGAGGFSSSWIEVAAGGSGPATIEVTTEEANSGSFSAKITYINDEDSATLNFDFGDQIPRRSLFIRRYEFFNETYDFPFAQKLHRVVNTRIQPQDNRFEYTMVAGGAANDETPGIDDNQLVLHDFVDVAHGVTGFKFERGRWYCVEIHLLPSTPGADDGRIVTWIDGVMWRDITGKLNRDDPGADSYSFIQIGMNYTNRGGGENPNPIPDAEDDTFRYIDDIVIMDQYVGRIDDTAPVVSGFSESDGVVTVHISDVETGVDPGSISISVNGGAALPAEDLTISGSPYHYTITFTPGAFSTITVNATSFYIDPAEINEALTADVVLNSGTPTILDIDGDGSANAVDQDDDNDGFEDFTEDVFPESAYLRDMNRVNDADSNSNGTIGANELRAFANKFSGKLGDAELGEMIAVLSWAATGTRPVTWDDPNDIQPEVSLPSVSASVDGKMVQVVLPITSQ